MPKKSAQKSEYSSVGRTFACQAKGHEFESRYSLHKKTHDIPSKFGTKKKLLRNQNPDILWI